MTLQSISEADVKKAARDQYDAGLLTAQHPVPERRKCVNRDGDYKCGVAASFSDETFARMDAAGIHKNLDTPFNEVSITTLVGAGMIDIADGSLITVIREIQKGHDDWAQASKDGWSTDRIEAERDYFLRLIDHPSVAVQAAA